MQSREASTPPISKTKIIKTSFLTPCRRLGLARKSPATSGTWRAPKSSIVSPSENRDENEITPIKTLLSDSNHDQDQVTPKRSSMGLIRNPRAVKVRKTYISPVQNSSIEGQQMPELKTLDKSSVRHPQENDAVFTEHNSLPEDSLFASVVTESMVEEVRMRVNKKEEELKDLQLATTYKKKQEVKTLETLIVTWREGCQNALQELQSLLDSQGHHLSMGELLDHLCIPHELVHYTAEADDFD